MYNCRPAEANESGAELPYPIQKCGASYNEKHYKAKGVRQFPYLSYRFRRPRTVISKNVFNFNRYNNPDNQLLIILS